jgi:hypothetical protein
MKKSRKTKKPARKRTTPSKRRKPIMRHSKEG